MKNFFTICIMGLSVFSANAQLPVSQTAGNKQALLEEFTGNTCQYCPDGHNKSDQITSANPGKAFAINIHSGTYAPPGSSSASLDFRTPDGDTIRMMPGNSGGGYPKGSVNRRVPTFTVTSYAPYSANGWTMSRSYWANNVSDVLSESAYVNVAGQATLNTVTRALTVNMEAYYTATAPVSANKISIALVQNNIIAWQTGASAWYPSMLQTSGDNATYKHMHALRDMITNRATGEDMGGNVTSGTLWSRTYNYTIPSTYPASGTKTIPAVLADMELIAFITEGTGNVIAVCKVPITLTVGTDDLLPTSNLARVNVYPSPMQYEGVAVYTLNKPSPVNVQVTNTIGQTVLEKKYEHQPAGEYKLEFNTTEWNNGVYFINIDAEGSVMTKKFSVLK